MKKSVLIIVVAILAWGVADAQTYYSKFVTSLDQAKKASPVRKDKKVVYEGCGAIATAMLLGYWQTERGKTDLLVRGFNGTADPRQRVVTDAIRALYVELKSKKAPGKKQLMSYTMPDSLFSGLKKRGAKKGLKADRVKKSAGWSKKESELKAQLKKKNPVILLKNKEHKDGCLGDKSTGWDLIKNISNAHYFLAVGYSGNQVAIMPGFANKNKSFSTGFSVHSGQKIPGAPAHLTGKFFPNKSSHYMCTFDELRKANVSLFWLEQ